MTRATEASPVAGDSGVGFDVRAAALQKKQRGKLSAWAYRQVTGDGGGAV
jgi:hypothetical protein